MNAYTEQIDRELVQKFLPEVDELSEIVQRTKITKITPNQNGQIYVKFNNFKPRKFPQYSMKDSSVLTNHFFQNLCIFINEYVSNMVINDPKFPHMHMQDQRTYRTGRSINCMTVLKTKLTQEALDNIQSMFEQLKNSFSSPKMLKKLEEGRISKKKFSMKFAKKRISYEIKQAIKLDLNEEDLMQLFRECLAEEIISS